MPWLTARPCRRVGCAKLVRGRAGFCDTHQREEWKRQDAARPSCENMEGENSL
jgi:hypothetical protein